MAWDKSFYDRWKKEKSALIDMLIEREGSSGHPAFAADHSSPKPHGDPTESEQFIHVKSKNYNVQKLPVLFKKVRRRIDCKLFPGIFERSMGKVY